VNVCVNGYNTSGKGLYNNSCFVYGTYGNAAVSGSLTGQDPDTFLLPGNTETVDAAGGVAPIDISSNLVSGSQSVVIDLSDQGGYLTASSLFLTTNCTQQGVTGPAQVSGNPISPSNPTPAQLTQSFNFDTGSGQQISFVYDLSGAQAANTLTIDPSGPIPQTADSPLDPAEFKPVYAAGTPFATSRCLIHTGELLPDGSPACKLYTLECTLGTGTAASGAQCPVSTVANEVIQEVFDGPQFKLHDIHTPEGITFHEGIGLLMASEGWTGGPCTFDPASGLEDLPCPHNLLISFSGPGSYDGTAITTHPNSSFISVARVPEDLTTVWVEGVLPDQWINSRTAQVRFFSQPPNLTHTKLHGAEHFIPSPIAGITYGISPAGSEPTPAQEPIANDITLTNAAANCSTPPTAKIAPNFAPPPQTLTFPADGQYLLHYYAEDCAGTEELQFTQTAGVWSTHFYTYPINVDTVPPVISFSTPAITPAGPYRVGEVVYANYSCTDQTSETTPGSGVVFCGFNFYAPGSTYNTGQLRTRLDTLSPGTKTFTAWAVDGAGNFSSASVTYTVAR
jgi:hypothetical protein